MAKAETNFSKTINPTAMSSPVISDASSWLERTAALAEAVAQPARPRVRPEDGRLLRRIRARRSQMLRQNPGRPEADRDNAVTAERDLSADLRRRNTFVVC